MKYRVVAMSLFCLAGTTSCVGDSAPKSIAETIELRGPMEGKSVVVHGYIEVDRLLVPWFLPARGKPVYAKTSNSIDIIPETPIIERELASLDGACVILEGEFESYKRGVIKTGNLASRFGSIMVRNVRICGGGAVERPD
jgi:hypothetical protein